MQRNGLSNLFSDRDPPPLSAPTLRGQVSFLFEFFFKELYNES